MIILPLVLAASEAGDLDLGLPEFDEGGVVDDDDFGTDPAD